MITEILSLNIGGIRVDTITKPINFVGTNEVATLLTGSWCGEKKRIIDKYD